MRSYAKICLALVAGSAAGCSDGAPAELGNRKQECVAISGCNDAGPDDSTASSGRPDFGNAVEADSPPPPISGGTLLVARDGRTAIASDPDRDAVYLVDLAARALVATIPLARGDEPGRVTEDGAGRVHVALRGGGAVVTIDPASAAILTRRDVCPAPRGIAWDETADAIVVACATGELVTLPAAGGPPTRTLRIERDLRDVVVYQGAIAVSTFRSAEILRLASDGTIVRRDVTGGGSSFASHLAWRAVPMTQGRIAVVYQLESQDSLSTKHPDAYTVAMRSAVSIVDPAGHRTDLDAGDAVLPVDVAVSPDGTRALVAAPGNAFVAAAPTAFLVPFGGAAPVAAMPAKTAVQPIAVAFDSVGDTIVQTREPATLWLRPNGADAPTAISLSDQSRRDTGHDVFHTRAGGNIACASCHAEAGDDGHTWVLDGERRRTPSLRGTIEGTAPYHWKGDQADLHSLVDDVYTGRMSGAKLATDQRVLLERWVGAVPAPPAPSWIDAAAAQRGRALFERADVGCSGCHAGSKFTNNATVAVGPGGAFQVPPLVGVGWRTPLLHDGCAKTIADRFDACASPGHGDLSRLSASDTSDLAAYLESL